MRKRYDYYINGKVVGRQEMVNALEKCCRKVVGTHEVADWCSADIVEFDKKKFNKNMRQIENGNIVLFFGDNKTSFYRKVKEK